MNPDKMMEAFEKFIKSRKLCTKYGAPLTKSKCGNFYKDVRVQGHWVTWQHASEQFL